jgi:YfiH family protein
MNTFSTTKADQADHVKQTDPALPAGWVRPDLGGPDGSVGGSAQGVLTLMSARAGGRSQGFFADCNLGQHVQDDPVAVQHNRAVFAEQLGVQPVWLQQVHGDRVVRLGAADLAVNDTSAAPIADGALTNEPGVGCVVMVADCLPLLLAAPLGRGVAALHAGWRGLAGAGPGMQSGRGIVHKGVEALCDLASCEPSDLSVWLGPCIGPRHFEVGADVLCAFGLDPSCAFHPRFTQRSQTWPRNDVAVDQPKWLADLPGLADDALRQLGVRRIRGEGLCTASDPARFFSFRRDGRTGRLAAGIGLR